MLTSRQQFKFVLALPIINVIADSTQGYTSQGLTSPGYLRAIIVLLFVFIHFKNFYRRTSLNQIIIFSLVYFLILGFFSSKMGYTFSVYLKYLIASLMFPIGYYYFDSFDKYRYLIRVMAWTLGIYIFFLVLSNVLGLGSSDYLEDSVYFGAGRVNSTKAMMILVLMAPLVFRFDSSKVNRRIYLLVLISSLVFIFLGIKRTALLGLFVGYILYFILTPYKSRLIKSLTGVAILLLLFSPLFLDTALNRFEARQEAGRFDISQAQDEEARVLEFYAVLDAFNEGNLWYKLFGAEFLNSPSFFRTTRMLHMDYTTMLQGSGLLGLFLFLFIFYLVFSKSFQYRRIFKNNNRFLDITAVSLAILIGLIILSFSGSVTSVGIRSIAFMFWGASFSYLDSEYRKLVFKYKGPALNPPRNTDKLE